MRNGGDVSEEIGGTVFTDDVVMHLFVNPVALLFPFDGFAVHLKRVACVDRLCFRFIHLIEGEVTVFSGKRPRGVPVA